MRIVRRFFNWLSAEKRAYGQQLQHLLGFKPVNVNVYKLAFKHTSKAVEAHNSNERLEYLGDAVLDAIISEYLFKKYPFRGEGFLTEMRSKIVKRKKLGEIGEFLQLKEFLEYDRNYVNLNATILGNAVEALIGAIYLDQGYDTTKQFIFDKIIYPYIDLDELVTGDINFKSRLFEWSQKYNRELTFEVLRERMQGSYRLFNVGVYVDGEEMGKGEGRSKKDAQKEAARIAYVSLNVAEELEREL